METIAIPTYNEGQRIEGLLASLETEAPPSVAEILICDNASTDNTAQVVARWAQQREHVRLIKAQTPGKPAAWNRLFEEATAPVVVFLDADIKLRPGSLSRLIKATTEGRHIVYSGRRRFRANRAGLGQGLVAELADPVLELCLQGTCYALHKEPVRARMREAGFNEMPDVFAEDIWLNAILAPGDLGHVQSAVVDVELDGFGSYLALHARKSIIADELETLHPDLARRLESNHPEALQALAQGRAVIGGKFSVAAKLRWLAGAALKLGTNTIFRQRLTRIAQRYKEIHNEYGGSHLLRHVASTSPRADRPTHKVAS